MLFNLAFISSIILDIIFGDPRNLPHPVRYIGWLCTIAEKRTRRLLRRETVAGRVAFLLVLVGTLLPLLVFLTILHHSAPVLEIGVAVILLYLSIACRDLHKHSLAVYRAVLMENHLEQARKEIARIVGRDTSALDRQAICRACVETVAENLVDGVTAPIFYAVLASLLPGGDVLSPLSLAVLGAYGYKAINTMDSMYGYKNDQYIDFGRFAAKTDDLVNYLPSRISGLFLIIAAGVLRLDFGGAYTIFLRDRLNHSSPNAGHPEAAVAGALGVRLGGASSYFGKIVDKPTIGDDCRSVSPEDIVHTNRLMFVSALLFSAAMLASRICVTG